MYYLEQREGLRVAVVAAHPDDEALSCPGLLAAAAGAGSTISLIWSTTGEMSASVGSHRRLDEGAELAAALGADFRTLAMNDGALTVSQLVPAIESTLRELRPELVVWPFGVSQNQHQDHAALHQAMVNIAGRWPCEDCCWIAGHPPVDDDSRFAPNLFLPLGDDRLKAMLRLPAIYRSEAGKVFMSRDFLSTRARHSSFRLRSRAEYIEVYQLMKGVPPPALFAMRNERPAPVA
jgi:LmbE family N-acetylglucosaminyl deacetylase